MTFLRAVLCTGRAGDGARQGRGHGQRSGRGEGGLIRRHPMIAIAAFQGSWLGSKYQTRVKIFESRLCSICYLE
jgi:hypothetical protein